MWVAFIIVAADTVLHAVKSVIAGQWAISSFVLAKNLSALESEASVQVP